MMRVFYTCGKAAIRQTGFGLVWKILFLENVWLGLAETSFASSTCYIGKSVNDF